jgi:ABC-type multidrug transport system fused ATPase/permease subunit
MNPSSTPPLPVAPLRATLQELWLCTVGDRLRAGVALLFLMFATLSALAATRCLGFAIDAIADGEHDRITRIGITLLALTSSAGISGYLGRVNLAVAIEQTLARFRVRAFDSAIHLPLETIEEVGTADPLARLTGDIGSVTDAAHDVFPMALLSTMTIGLTGGALFLTDYRLGLAAMVMAPTMAFALRYYFRRARPRYLVEQESYARVAATVHEVSTGASTIRAYQQHPYWLQRLHDALTNQWKAAWPPSVLRIILFPSAIVSVLIGLCSVLVTGYFLFDAGTVSVGTVAAASLFVTQLGTPIATILDSLNLLQQAVASASRVAGIGHGHKYESFDARQPMDGSVELQDVHFSYRGGNEVLHGVDLRIASGERVAVVGPSGAGKSTIAKLIAGIHHVDSGAITVGGVGVADIARTSSRRCIALVTQESHVFLGTVATNCRLSKRDATDDEIHDALRTVQALEWVEQLSDGIYADVGPTGQRLTLVQSQQVALARVLLADPLVVILDEATAGLGSDSARGIEQAFAAVLAGRTVITIAHRLDVAKFADRVVVVENGSVAAGTHEELLQTSAIYARLWSHWH